MADNVEIQGLEFQIQENSAGACLLYTSDAADE